MLRAGARTGDRLVIVTGDGEGASVPPGVRVAGDHALRHGHRAWYHEEVAGRRWRISARSFFQARPDGADVLVAEVATALDGRPGGGPLVDLYGGVGPVRRQPARTSATPPWSSRACPRSPTPR